MRIFNVLHRKDDLYINKHCFRVTDRYDSRTIYAYKFVTLIRLYGVDPTKEKIQNQIVKIRGRVECGAFLQMHRK